MNLDDKIKQALQMDAKEVEQALAQEKGLFGRLLGIYQGNMAGWNIFGTVLAVITAILIFWTGYEFFVSQTVDDRVFWGVLLIIAGIANAMLKIWFWMEMNRHSATREIKRLELAVMQLSAKIKS